jgi:ribose transport system substrate-binding protein
MQRRLLFLALAVAVCAGCGDVKPPPRTIGLSLLTLTNPFFKEIADTMQAEAAKHGYEVIAVSGDQDVTKQKKQVEDFLIRKVDAIVLCPCDSKAIGSVIQDANAAGVPVFTVDIGSLAPQAKVVTHIATDNYSGGQQAGEAVLEVVGKEGGKVAILDHRMVESCILRVQGFKEVIDKHNAQPGAAQIKIVAELPSGGSKDQGYKSMEDLLQAHADLKAVFAINDPSALGARAALEKAGKAERIQLIGFDGQLEGKQAIKDGKIYADPIQYPDQIGRQAALTISAYFEGKEVPAQILIPTSLYRKRDGEKDPLLR